MNVGEKIKFYRELRGITQTDLAKSISIPVGTLQKYEINNRNPKEDQLTKIANGLMISVHALKNIELNTIDDILPYLIAISKAGNLQIEGSKDQDGKYIEDTLSFKFQSKPLNRFMKEWADKKEVIDKLRLDAKNSPDVQAKEYLLKRADEIEQEIELRMIDSQMFIDMNKDKK